MNYRALGRTGIKVSEIGLGSEAFVNKDDAFAQELINTALDAGINYFDLYNPEPYVRDAFGKAMKGRREKFVMQAHMCSAWIDGQYKRTRKMDEVKPAFADLLTRLGTDYIDVGMIHYVDEQKDFDEVFGGPVIEFAKEQKAQGKIKHIGMSTHNPRVAIQAVKSGLIDVIMFSINPAYDILPPNEDVDTLFKTETYQAPDVLSSTDPERQKLYSLCESQGVALTVMKPYGGGRLLDEKRTPFPFALTPYQCIQYALDKPGVLSVLPGVGDRKRLKEYLDFLDAPANEKDYSCLGEVSPAEEVGACVYCNHCAPCPAGIDVGLVNKYYDLARVGDKMAVEHYRALSKHAEDCTACGHCDGRCPFQVKQSARMGEIGEYFGL